MEEFPGTRSLAKFSIRHLLVITAGLSFCLPFLLAAVPAWIGCSRATVSLLGGWYLLGSAGIVAIAFFRRWMIERRLGARFIRIESTLRGARAMAPMFGAMSLVQFLVACYHVATGRSDEVETAQNGVVAGAVGGVALLCWLWQHALRSIEFGANGYCRHVLSFTPWGCEPVRWIRHGTNSMIIIFGRAGHRSLRGSDEQLTAVESLLARYDAHHG